VNRNGTAATKGLVIPVPRDRLPAPLPPGANPALVISIQAMKAVGTRTTSFQTPAPVTFPNLDGLLPGDKVVINSFNHDAARWDRIGTATVSADGQTIVSDPGVGILAPGWHWWQKLVDFTGKAWRFVSCANPAARYAIGQNLALGFDLIASTTAYVETFLAPLLEDVPVDAVSAVASILGKAFSDGSNAAVHEAYKDTADLLAIVGLELTGVGIPTAKGIELLDAVQKHQEYIDQLEKEADAFRELGATIRDCLKDSSSATVPSDAEHEAQQADDLAAIVDNQLDDGPGHGANEGPGDMDQAHLEEFVNDLIDLSNTLATHPDGADDPVVLARVKSDTDGIDNALGYFAGVVGPAAHGPLDLASHYQPLVATIGDRFRSLADHLVHLPEQSAQPAASVYFAIQRSDGQVLLRGRTDNQGGWNAELPEFSAFTVSFYDPFTGFSWSESIHTGRSGTPQQEDFFIVTRETEDADGDGQGTIADPNLATAHWMNVTGLSNGIEGNELLRADAVNEDGTVLHDRHNSSGAQLIVDQGTVPDSDGWASLTFDVVHATGLRIGFQVDPAEAPNPPFNYYRVYEVQVY
jgi:hypothetical protein